MQGRSSTKAKKGDARKQREALHETSNTEEKVLNNNSRAKNTSNQELPISQCWKNAIAIFTNVAVYLQHYQIVE